jgi:hypothetical protein
VFLQIKFRCDDLEDGRFVLKGTSSIIGLYYECFYYLQSSHSFLRMDSRCVGNSLRYATVFVALITEVIVNNWHGFL